MDNSMYLLKDTESKSIKQDHNGMLCIFTDKKNAERFRSRLHEDDKNSSQVIEIDCKIKAI